MGKSRTYTCAQRPCKRRKRPVYLKFSHDSLRIFGRAYNPLFRKPRLAGFVQKREGGGGEEEEKEGEEKEEEIEHLNKTHSQRQQNSNLSSMNFFPSKAKPKSYLEKLQSRLSGGRFRMLNEKLYTSSGDEAFKFFKEDPSAFDCYHEGYQEQMSRWPSQPLDVIINWLNKHSKHLTVADFGCGSGKLAKSVKNQVFSLDLVATDETIIACNMAHTPLNSHSIDIAVFCLSLMGTDYPSFLAEAHRVLKNGGTLLIAEVRSRFDPKNGGADPTQFIKALGGLGFSCVNKV
ncbi:hypothetical protein KP509_14G088500 [Ceratopteris richardii]|uniref:Ribosomal RNA-processing protein 8 n=1 Tax=Ceratopteris richardii TaxID=49495 RepID=A0A8T2TH99_CERRI|nr:hypothetical protein KP509_14G088500 [Ceratopteris richardii]